MSLDPVSAGTLHLQQGAGLAARLAPGQVVKAQVLHHYEGQRYLVRILGHDSVVDSASPLRPGDSLRARVTRLGERIELERLAVEAEGAEALAPETAGAGGGDLVEELFRRFRGTLEPAAAERLRRKVAHAARPERMALAGLVLSKLGVPIDDELLDATCDAMALRAAPREVSAPAAQPLAGALVPDAAAGAGLRVLNVQAGGALAHQAGAVLLRTGTGEITAEIAVFEEDAAPEGRASRLRHRKLVLALEAPGLGRVEARALTADEHLRVALATGTPGGTRALMRHGEALARELAGEGWRVDEIAYETRERAGPGAALGALLEHLVTPGSVSRLA